MAAHYENDAVTWLALAGWILVCFLVAIVSGITTAKAIPTWYASLIKPSFNPPNWVFAPVWTLLYALMGVAVWLVWRMPDSPDRTTALVLFCVQLLLNFAWSWIFFSQHRIGAALIEIAVLWAAILLMMLKYAQISRAAMWMTVPYLCWVTFASALNLGIWRANFPK